MPIAYSHPDLLHFTDTQLKECCASCREEIIATVTRQGGHLASSLGAVELCVALHRCFDFNGNDAVFFDVGHQAYAHKLLTGRVEPFQHLRETDGCSGFPTPLESPADPVFAGHAGVALSQAIGAAKAMDMQHRNGRVIAVIGDGSLGCGIIWEALNNLEHATGRLIIILNDNQMSISPSKGILRSVLNRMITGCFYNRIRANIKNRSCDPVRHYIRRFEHHLKGLFFPSGILFQEFGLRYLGPVDGNDVVKLVEMFNHLPTDRPLLLHIVTKKGLGYPLSEENPTKYHSISPAPQVSLPDMAPKAISYSRAFSNALLALADKHQDIVAISAAMLDGTGLEAFSQRYPQRCFDTGIAEEHAVAFASGLATQGFHPIIALYSTFLQRALDNVYHDICLNSLPVILCIDRTGAVPDGPTHHGIYALPFLLQLPNLTILCPADEQEMTAMLNYAYALKSPVILRYPRGTCHALPETNQPIEHGKSVILKEPASANLTIWATGAELTCAFALADMLEQSDNNLHVRIVNPRFLLPFDKETAIACAQTPQIVLDDYSPGGLKQCLESTLCNLPHAPVIAFTWPENTVLGHGNIAQLRRNLKLDMESIAAELLQTLGSHKKAVQGCNPSPVGSDNFRLPELGKKNPKHLQ